MGLFPAVLCPELGAQCSKWGLPSAEQSREHLPHPAACALCSAPQGTIGHQGTLLTHGHPVGQLLVNLLATIDRLGHQGTLLAHSHLVGHQDPQVLLCRAPFQQLSPRPALMRALIPPQVEDMIFPLVNPC